MLMFCYALLAILLFTFVLVFHCYLCSLENKWLGFIIPAITSIIGMAITSFPIFSLMFNSGEYISMLLPCLLSLLLGNILTIILLVIYWAFRVSRKRKDNKNQLNKMNIQDL